LPFRPAELDRLTTVACGTAYYACMVAKYWFENLAGLAVECDIASEFRYRDPPLGPNTAGLFVSQSGETADTLAALRYVKGLDRPTLSVVNVPESSLAREADGLLRTLAGPEIGVASTKAFTTQLVALLLLTTVIGHYNGLGDKIEAERTDLLRSLPAKLESALELDATIARVAERFVEKHHTLFLGRGDQYPIAMEGALKLKEISYIHAEAYPAGELKHGPLALIDEDMPVVTVAPNNSLLEKLKSNLEEVRARGGELIVFADDRVDMQEEQGVTVIRVPRVDGIISPIVFTIPLQLLAYHVAVLKGTDVDQPRNLAKSVTVE
jgi:glucosamine--fructose-6-phosphate aminotransferase (isomerizing)